MTNDWMQKATKRMASKQTEGKFSAAAHRAGMGTQAYANKVIRDLKGKTYGDKGKVKRLRQAVFARTAMSMRR